MTSPTRPDRKRYLAAAALLAGALLSGGPASTQDQSADEVQRFCGNIVDAAKERRYLMQKQELEEVQRAIEERIAILDTRRAEYEEWLARRDQFLARAEDNLVSIYGLMRPDAAAVQLKELRGELAAAILMKLDARKASVILNEMETGAAAQLTSIIAHAARTEDPS